MDQREIRIAGQAYRLESLLSSRASECMDEITKVYEARRVGNNSLVIIKLRLQQTPDPREPPSEVAALIELGRRDFREELQSLSQCGMDGVPRLYGHEELEQGNDHFYPYPGVYLLALIMERVPGVAITRLDPWLSAFEAAKVNSHLATMFEAMRRKGFSVGSPESEHVFFDRDAQRTYFIGMSAVLKDAVPSTHPITVTSKKVTMFCVDSFIEPNW